MDETKCRNGLHSLVVIIDFGPDQDSTVVRWCEKCGSVVVDRDYDGRTNPGAIRPMQFPKGEKTV